jgi:hypothetical protein
MPHFAIPSDYDDYRIKDHFVLIGDGDDKFDKFVNMTLHCGLILEFVVSYDSVEFVTASNDDIWQATDGAIRQALTNEAVDIARNFDCVVL